MSRRLLLIDGRVLTPDRDGGSMRMFGLVGILQSLDFSISFVASFPESFFPFADSLAEDTERMRDAGIEMQLPGTTVDEHLEEHGHRYDVVLITGTFVASRHLASVRRLAPRAAVVFDTIDLHFLREFRGAKLSGSIPRLQGALKVKRVELALARAADFTVVVSTREQDILAGEKPPIRSWILPLTYEVQPSPGPDDRHDLVFLGAFSFDPNPDAVVFFVEHILPRIHQRLPGVTLHVVGSDPTPEVLRLHGAGVNVTGPIENLADCFDRRRVFVAPLRYGAGVKIKLLMSMAHGLPVVASPIAVEGIPVRDGADVMVAADRSEWVDRVARVYEDPDLWSRLSAGGRNLVSTHYSFAAVHRQAAALTGAILERLHNGSVAS